MPFIILIFSFFIIIKAAEFLIDAAADLANYLRVPQLIIGLTVVAFGTSAPEAAVNVLASLQGKNDIAIGNIVGSNIMNIGVVIGITALIFTIEAEWTAIRIDIPFAFISSMVFALLVLDGLSRNDGLVFAILFFVYLNYLWLTSKASYFRNQEESYGRRKKLGKILFFLCIGIVGVVLGGHLIIESSVKIARFLGFSEAFIALTVISFGTSLPELVTCLTACYKKSDSIAVGNMVGSNIFNILFVLSLSSVISPIAFNMKLVVDIGVMLLLTLFLFIFSYTGKKVSRIEGLSLAVVYILYFSFILIRN